MNRAFFASLLLISATGFASATVHGQDLPKASVFDQQIAPLLADHCLECHSSPEPKGGLDLSNRDKAMAGGESGKALAAGKLAGSLLWQRVESDEMPPKHPLPANQKQILRAWILAGATWGEKPDIDRFQFTTGKRAGYDWWSLQPLRNVQPPEGDSNWVRNEIDRFILAALQKQGLQPSHVAEPRALVRRLYFDLVGLPPTPEEIERFAADPSDKQYAALVDRLLQSPHYGERWGRHWLDVVRYGESDGFERNGPRNTLWHYRDWVIQAFNDDMPYNEFARRQLAGDLIDPGPKGAASVGFLVAGVHNTVVGGSERMKRLARQDELEEIIGAIGQTFLGLTVNCARCHDHKFDPVQTREYYQLISSIDGVNHGEREVPLADSATMLAAIRKQLQTLQTRKSEIDNTARKQILAQREKDKTPDRRPERPKAFASWEFEDDLRDSVGALHGKAVGNARLDGGALVVDGSSFVQTETLGEEIAEKTLEAWVVLDNLDQRGGGAISLQTLDGRYFDAIVFGEREPGRWMAGSDGFTRTSSFQGPNETSATTQPVHFAIVYEKDGKITGYRNGAPYGKPYKTGFARFAAGKSQVVFGLRHSPQGSNKMLKARILRANLYDRALPPDAIAASAGVENRFVSEKAIIKWLSEERKQQRASLIEAIAKASQEQSRLESLAKTKIYSVRAGSPGAMRVHIRGSVTEFGDEVPPGGVGGISGVNADFQLQKNASDKLRRLKLAEWITDTANPLFSRVIVNRIWHYHFGTAIVETPNDLGFNGGRPSHPRLIDWLAQQLIADGFRMKALHRRIVLSATYRQASKRNEKAEAKDADNRLLWRTSPRRIEAEALRDAMLQVAGVLNTARGGPGFVDVSIVPNNGTTYYEPIDPEGDAFHRRTVYRFTPRGGRSAVLDTFDCPDPSAAAPRRSVTTTPLQALSLLNNSFVLRMSDKFAERVKREAGESAARQVQRSWQLAVGRKPDAEEQKLAEELVARHGLSALCRALFNSNEFVIIE